MSKFILTIFCLTTSNLPWFMDLTFQVPVQYCSLQHWKSCSSPDTSATESCFHFGPATSFFLGLLVVALHSSRVEYWIPSDLGDSSFAVTFFVFLYSPWAPQQACWSGLPFPPPMDCVLSGLSGVTCPFWVALHGVAYSFTELCTSLCHDKAVIHEGFFFVVFF